MVQKMKDPILASSYYSKFSCSGEKCEDCCCIGWNITMDRGTYKKYKGLPKSDLKDLINSGIKRIRTGATELNYATIKLNEDGRCPFLSGDRLCQIQRTYGEQYLSYVCNTYPRYTNLVDNVFERSLTVSCPEAARLVLDNPDGIEYDETEESASVRKIIKKQIWTQGTETIGKVQGYFWPIRFFVIQVLQNRELSINERMLIIGMFCRKLQDLIDRGSVHEIPGAIMSYEKFVSEKGLDLNFTDSTQTAKIQMLLLTSLIDARSQTGFSSHRFVQCFEEFLKGIKYSYNASVDNVIENYQRALSIYYLPFMNQHEYLLENYLVNSVFSKLFPLASTNSIFEEFILLAVDYSLIKLLLIGMAGYHESLTVELTVKLVQSFEKAFEHNPMFSQQLLDAFKDKGYATMPYMAILFGN